MIAVYCLLSSWECDALQGKNLENFDHVKKNLSLQDADELAAQEADPMFSIKAEGLSEDMKRVMSKLNTADAAKARLSPPPLQSLLDGYSHLSFIILSRTQSVKAFWLSSDSITAGKMRRSLQTCVLSVFVCGQAFEQGGGGKKAQAARLLAEAHSTAKRGGDKAEAGKQDGAQAGPDPR